MARRRMPEPNPFREGVDARMANRSIAQCPYPADSHNAREWKAGFAAASRSFARPAEHQENVGDGA